MIPKKNDTKYLNLLKESVKLKLKEDLAVWFGTKKKPKGSSQPKGPWVNICRKKEGGGHPPCGRPEAEDKGYPKCRAAGVASKMTDAQKRAACAQKRKAEKTHSKTGTGNSPKMVSYKPKKQNESLQKIIRRVILESYYPSPEDKIDMVCMNPFNRNGGSVHKNLKFESYIPNDKMLLLSKSGKASDSAYEAGDTLTVIFQKVNSDELRQTFNLRPSDEYLLALKYSTTQIYYCSVKGSQNRPLSMDWETFFSDNNVSYKIENTTSY